MRMLRLVKWLIVAVSEFLLLETGLVGVRNSLIGQIEYLNTLNDSTLRITALVLALIVALLAIGPTRLNRLRASVTARGSEVGERRRDDEPDVNVGDRGQYMSNSPGGQQALGDIFNQGLQPRKVPTASAQTLVRALSEHPSQSCQIAAIMGDSESYQLAQQLKEVLSQAGWSVSGVDQEMYGIPPEGSELQTPEETVQARILLNWLEQVGLQPTGYLNKDVEYIKIIAGRSS